MVLEATAVLNMYAADNLTQYPLDLNLGFYGDVMLDVWFVADEGLTSDIYVSSSLVRGPMQIGNYGDLKLSYPLVNYIDNQRWIIETRSGINNQPDVINVDCLIFFKFTKIN